MDIVYCLIMYMSKLTVRTYTLAGWKIEDRTEQNRQNRTELFINCDVNAVDYVHALHQCMFSFLNISATTIYISIWELLNSQYKINFYWSLSRPLLPFMSKNFNIGHNFFLFLKELPSNLNKTTFKKIIFRLTFVYKWPCPSRSYHWICYNIILSLLMSEFYSY